jgi:hypothetical protein
MKALWIKVKWLLILCILSCFLLVWCGNNWISKNELVVNVWEFELRYAWNIKLSKVPLKTDDLSEIVDLYQEVWDNVWYRDSLLIAQKYSGWFWINAFAQDNLNTLEDNGLSLSNINKKQVYIQKEWNEINAVLVDYEIVEWFVEEIPTLYISQLFIPDWSFVWLMSFITENSSSRKNMSNVFSKVM